MRRVALVYPNRYVGGIANTGLQYIYAKINELDAVCERFYSDVFDGLRSVETATPLSEFDVALFSLQYETDYFKAVEISRNFRGLKIAGGPCVMENPKPLLRYFDAFFIGEVEGHVEEILNAKDVEDLQGLPGIYTGREESVRRVYAKLGKHMQREIIGYGAYGRCFLLEIGRGCIRRCRFCIVRQIYFPPRWRKREMLPEVGEDKVAIIAPSPSDHPEFREILQQYVDEGKEVSPSSIRADTLDEELVDLLKLAGVKTLTIAPEAASPELQEILNKGIDAEDVYHAAELARGRFDKIKLYYMIGLPGENFSDVEAIVEQAVKVKGYVRKVEVSVNPLVPKPHTPMQWLPFGGKENVKEGINELRKKLSLIAERCRKAGIETDVSGVREFILQTILSRGDEDVVEVMEGAGYRRFGKYLEAIDVSSELPWDFIDHGYRKSSLLREYEKIFNHSTQD
nr:radical SAM protein [Archaeoglobus neptunius]